ncbi:hypothetical protein P348_00620 [Enterobacter sp. DC3]|nr:hypothetical protein P349_02545 [Enterobacter sp. DC4]EWG76894.1 hypothetical protein P348_00620 [Enterobacter sp. DC3]
MMIDANEAVKEGFAKINQATAVAFFICRSHSMQRVRNVISPFILIATPRHE